MTERLLAEQADYYRQRAAEYDATAYGDPDAARSRIDRLLDELRPVGHVLEIACGTGMWTAGLARTARSVVAVDAAAEAVAIARDRVPAGSVEFEVADIFSWQARRKFDTIFFSAWLSHVPDSRFDEFWQRLRACLAPDGRVLFVDEPIELRDKEIYVGGSSEIVERTLQDGRTYRIVKNFLDPDQLVSRLAGSGWQCRTWRDRDDWVWLCGEARAEALPPG